MSPLSLASMPTSHNATVVPDNIKTFSKATLSIDTVIDQSSVMTMSFLTLEFLRILLKMHMFLSPYHSWILQYLLLFHPLILESLLVFLLLLSMFL